ncbi:MAG: toxin-antitoxin system, antitoxin component [Nitrospirae bacterium]|nr:toxin-antitoxin system, antitoxin component [Nitrospirota bacterium]
MPTSGPRISAVVERPLYDAIQRIAARDQVSISEKARDLLREALELTEDAALEQLVNRRRRTSRRSYSLAEVRRRLRLD